MADNRSVTATSLAISPALDTVETDATVQFNASVVWSDGSTRNVPVTFGATGGIISPTGLFTAGTVPGTFLVVASCICGVVDTAQVVVTASVPRGELTITVAGLPSGTPAPIVITGPDDYRDTPSAPTTIDTLKPGEYVVEASPVVAGTSVYNPDRPVDTILVVAGENSAVEKRYSLLAPSDLPPHPRVWMNPARVDALRAKVAANDPRWLRIKGWADAQVAKAGAYTGGDENYLTAVCAAYLGTGQQAYATRAGVILEHYAIPSNDLRPDSGYYIRSSLPLVSAALDWCYAGLSVAVRRQTATWLMDRADWVWPETNPIIDGGQNKRYALDRATNNYWWGYMMTGPAALAAAGDDTVTSRDRPAEHRAIALAKWNGDGTAALALQAGGMWEEGTGYDSSSRVGSFTDAFLTSGIQLSHPFLRESLLWRIHSTMPGGKFKVPIGDQARVSTAPEFAYDRLMALNVLPSAQVDATLAGQIKSWLDWIGEASIRSGGLAPTTVNEFLRFDPAAPSVPLSTLPLSYLSSGTGTFVYRTSWTDPDATAFVFQSGLSTESHSDAAENQLLIWKGSFWISASANIHSHSGIRHETVYHNTMTVNGVGQLRQDGGGELLGTAVSDRVVMARGQAKGSYLPRSGPNPVDDFTRTVAYLPQADAFVVMDQVTVKDPAKEKVIRWHVATPPVINGKSFILRGNGPDQCTGDLLGPVDASVGSESFQLGQTVGSGDITSSAVTIRASGRPSDTFVTVIQCRPGPGSVVVPQLTMSASAATVTIGGDRVIMPLDKISVVRVE